MSGGFIKYVKKAFLYHWNLLSLGSLSALGFISGYPDVVLPLTTALELIYLALLSTHPRFQRFVDATELQDKRTVQGSDSSRTVYRILGELNFDDRKKYDRLHSLCLELQRIAGGVKGKTGQVFSGVNDTQMNNINRLLWIYLKLLYSKTSLESFFKTTDERELKANMNSTREKLKALGPENEDTPKEAMYRKSLDDTYQTYDMRLKNYETAKDNHEFIQIELERLYSKIAGIAEMGINRQDARSITSEIDVVSSSVLQTEKTMQEIEYITGVTFNDEETPVLLNKGMNALRVDN